MPIGDLAPEIAVLFTAVATLLFAMFAPRRLHVVGAIIALSGLTVAGVLLADQLGRTGTTFSGTFAIDGVGVWARFLILVATGVCVMISPGWFATDRRHGEVYAVFLLSAVGAMALAGAADLMQLVVAVLLSSVTGYTLAAYHRGWAISVEAGMKYFLIGALANAVLVTGVVFVTGMAGVTGYEPLANAFADGLIASPLLVAGLAMVAVGIAYKLGAAPAHTWVPDVAEGAPVPSAAFLTVVPKIGAAVAFARLVTAVPPDALALRPLVATIAAVTMTIGNLAALRQQDVRRLLGWSSVSQAGYVLMAVVVIDLDTGAPTALVAMLGAYTVGNIAAFAVVADLRGRTALSDYSGLAARRPLDAVVLALAFLSLVGIPPTVGFFGKFAVFEVTIAGGYGWLALVAAANTVVSLIYYARVLSPMVFDSSTNGAVAQLDKMTWAAAVTTGSAIIVLGLTAGLLLDQLANISLL
ncbi:proton-translocating NADH-quinone oxidoreductase subunit N [Stappia sp. 22II-S9-Z10]|nr:proton-translocating NADH-quinone oxidoreductase subunit N [Stappia sp. 22II-S9-Z10]